MITLFPDQADVNSKVRKAVGSGHKSVLLQGATGSGKTQMASDIVLGAYRKNKVCFFVVPRRTLLSQTSATLEYLGISHGFIAAGMDFDPDKKIFVCSTDTLRNRLLDVPKPDLVIIDEAHFGGDGLDGIIKFYKGEGAVVIGLSATPWKLSGKGLGCWFDHMVCGPSIKWLIENSRLSRYRGFAPSSPDLSGIRISGGDYAKGQLSDRMERDRVLIGDAVDHYKRTASGLLGIAYCVSIAHSKMTAESFRADGVRAEHMDGETSDEERGNIIRAFARREVSVLTNCDLLTFGFDLSSASGMNVTVEAMTDLRPTKSLALQCQKWGRVLRVKDTPAIILDHANNFKEHGFPDSDREWTLADRPVSSRRAAEKTIEIKMCPECFHVHRPAPHCPECGAVYEVKSREVKQVGGELEEILIPERHQTMVKQNRMEVGRARTLADLHRIASDRGYKAGWVWKQASLKGIKN